MGAFEDNNRKYAEAFSRLREKGGLSLQEVSKRSGVALSTLSRTCKAKRAHQCPHMKFSLPRD